jgi:hypothetical protein
MVEGTSFGELYCDVILPLPFGCIDGGEALCGSFVLLWLEPVRFERTDPLEGVLDGLMRDW